MQREMALSSSTRGLEKLFLQLQSHVIVEMTSSTTFVIYHRLYKHWIKNISQKTRLI